MSDDNWFYAQGQQQQGPVTLTTLRRLLSNGQIRPSDLVWNPSMPQWAPAQTVTALGVAANVGVARMAEQQGYPPQHAPPAQVLNYGLAPGGYHLQYAGFWLRFCAAFVDGLIIGIPFTIVDFIVEAALGPAMNPGGTQPSAAYLGFKLLSGLTQVLAYWLYYALMESSGKQATLGKMAVGLIVTDLDGGRISFARASGRHFAKFLSMIILYIGFIMAAFTARKQGLHDIVASTLVVKKPPQ